MLALTLNPGFVPIVAALLALAAPRGLGPATMAGAALAALWLLLDRQFGAATAMAQMGLPVVLLNLDELNRIFGIALLIGLIIIATYSGARRNRYEDAAILLLAGGSVSALFVGDLVSFVAAAALAGLAAAWVTFASTAPGANRAGVRLLVWHGLEGLLFLVGVAFQLSGGAEASIFTQLDVAQIGGACIFAALLIRVGAPMAHVWLKDVVSHASPVGAPALSAFTTILGVYALARLFPAEPLLVPIGAAMIAVGAFFALTEDDLRRAGAYGLTAQIGVSVGLIGVGSPLALAAAAACAFTAMFAFQGLQMALGGIVHRLGHARISALEGLSRAMPVSAAFVLLAALLCAGAPGTAAFAARAIALDASAVWDLRGLWALIACLPAALFIGLGLRPAIIAFRGAAKPLGVAEAPFSMLLGTLLGAFFCMAIGLAPGWLYGLMPAQFAFSPYDAENVAPTVSLLGGAGGLYLLLRVTGLAPNPRAARLLDVDAFYRGPVAGAGRWGGVILLRIYGAARDRGAALAALGAAALSGAARRFDRPYEPGATAVFQWLTVGLMLGIMIWARDL